MALELSGFSNPQAIELKDESPAIRALADAVREGAITFDQINSHFAKGARQVADVEKSRNDVIRAREERPLIPKIAALSGQKADLEKLNTEAGIRAADFNKNLEKNAEDIKVHEAYLGQVAREADKIAAAAGPRELAIYQAYKASGRTPIYKAKDVLDYDAMEAVTSKPPEDGESKDLKFFSDNGVNPYDEKGALKPRAQLFNEVAAKQTATKPLTAQQQADALRQVSSTEALLSKVGKMSSVLFKTGPDGKVLRDKNGAAQVKDGNIVGPLAGSWVGRALSGALSVVGGQTFSEQRQLEMLTSGLVRELTQDLKGPLSEKELAFLQNSVPKISDPEDVWDSFFSEKVPALMRQIQESRSGLGAAAPAGAPAPAAPVTPPPANAIAPSDPRYAELSKQARTPTTLIDFNNIRRGEPYMFEGHLILKN
jgi:hypothetical protein